MLSLLRHELRVRRRAALGWMLILSFFSGVYIFIYPQLPPEIREMDPFALDMLRSMGVKTLATFEGFILGTEFNVLPLISGIFGVFMGTYSLIAEEDEGTLELLVSLPVSRFEVIGAKTMALFIIAFFCLVGAGLVGAEVFTVLSIEASISALALFMAIVSNWLIAFFFISFTLFLGAYLPHRTAVMSGSMGFLLLSFFGENLAGLAPVLNPYRVIFPFSYFKRIAEMLSGGSDWTDVFFLLLAGAVFLVLAGWGFQRRNLTVGAWPWQKRTFFKGPE